MLSAMSKAAGGAAHGSGGAPADAAATPVATSESRSITDSVGSRSDFSGTTAVPVQPQKPIMDVACVMDLHQPELLSQRKKAMEEIKYVCGLLRANFHLVQFEKLDFGETNILDTFYNADLAVVD